MWVPSVSLVQRQGESKGLWGLGGTHGREDRLASGRPGCQSPTSPPGSPRPQTQASEGLRSLWTDGHSPPSGPPLHPLAEAPLSVCHSLLRPPPTLPGPEDVMAGKEVLVTIGCAPLLRPQSSPQDQPLPTRRSRLGWGQEARRTGWRRDHGPAIHLGPQLASSSSPHMVQVMVLLCI